MRSVRATLATGAAVALASAGLALAGPATAAHATAAECTGGANGFNSIPYNQNGTNARTVSMGYGVTVRLQYGTVNGVQQGWARIDGSTIAGDKVWMDWTQTSGSTWMQCGPFTVQSNGSPNTSAAKRTSSSSSYQFRACGNLIGVGETKCTTWW